jgi:hypothetical protein
VIAISIRSFRIPDLWFDGLIAASSASGKPCFTRDLMQAIATRKLHFVPLHA